MLHNLCLTPYFSFFSNIEEIVHKKNITNVVFWAIFPIFIVPVEIMGYKMRGFVKKKKMHNTLLFENDILYKIKKIK